MSHFDLEGSVNTTLRRANDIVRREMRSRSVIGEVTMLVEDGFGAVGVTEVVGEGFMGFADGFVVLVGAFGVGFVAEATLLFGGLFKGSRVSGGVDFVVVVEETTHLVQSVDMA